MEKPCFTKDVPLGSLGSAGVAIASITTQAVPRYKVLIVEIPLEVRPPPNLGRAANQIEASVIYQMFMCRNVWH